MFSSAEGYQVHDVYILRLTYQIRYIFKKTAKFVSHFQRDTNVSSVNIFKPSKYDSRGFMTMKVTIVRALIKDFDDL